MIFGRRGFGWIAMALVALGGCGQDGDDTGAGASGAAGTTGPGGGTGAGGDGTGGEPTGGNGGMGGSASIGIPYAFVGLSNGDVLVHDLDLVSGELSLLHTVDAGANPTFLAIDPTRRYLYAVNEGTAEMAAFSVDAASAGLTFLNRVATGSPGPTHVNVDATGGWVFGANYSGGSMSIFEVQGDGSLGAAAVVPTGTQAHWIGTDPSNQFLFVPNKGTDSVSQFLFDASSGQATANTPAEVATASGAGPRHLAFHPSAPFAYVINELDDSMTAYAFDTIAGTLSPIQTLSTLPGGTGGGNNTCAEVVVSPDGRFLYGSNRGHDSIVVFSIDGQSGMMTLVDHAQTDIDTPRSFAVDPTGQILLVANQGSNSVASYAIGMTGTLTHLVTTAMPAAAPFVGIFDLPEPR